MKAQASNSTAVGSTIAPGVRGRPGPLQCAALTAVIVSCVAALALMTGVLPVSSPASVRESAAPSTPVPPAPTISSPPVAVPLGPTREVPARGAPGSDAALMAQRPAVAAPIGPDPVPQVAAEQAGPAPTAAGTPLNETPTARAPGATRARGQRHRLRLVQRKPHVRAFGKTREEVIAELMRAKRDGSYSANSEAYR